MIRRLRCWLWGHVWTEWIDIPQIDPDTGALLHAPMRMCHHCRQRQRKSA